MDNSTIITATVCVFSGRRNPQWTIPAKKYHELLLSIETLPGTSPQEQQSLLGYSGMLITGGKESIYAYKGVVTVTEKRQAKGYKDEGGKIEKQLLHSAPADVIEEIKGLLPEELK